MALVVEDGTGVAGAQSWVSVADSITYAKGVGNTAWQDADNELREQALRRAVRYLDAAYGSRYAGWRTYADQPMSWPRSGVVYDDGYELLPDVIPMELQCAQIEAAFIEFTKPDSSVGGGASGGARLQKQVTVGPISVTYEDSPAGAASKTVGAAGIPVYGAVDGYMQPLLDNQKTGGVAFLQRA
jgi:hypothetical protein